MDMGKVLFSKLGRSFRFLSDFILLVLMEDQVKYFRKMKSSVQEISSVIVATFRLP